MGYDENDSGALTLLDQFNKKGSVSITHYHFKEDGYSGSISNDPTQYRIVKW